MRARRAGTAPRASRGGGIASIPGAAVARRGWAQLYRALPRAQPGLAPRRQTRPDPAVDVCSLQMIVSTTGRRDALGRAAESIADGRVREPEDGRHPPARVR